MFQNVILKKHLENFRFCIPYTIVEVRSAKAHKLAHYKKTKSTKRNPDRTQLNLAKPSPARYDNALV